MRRTRLITCVLMASSLAVATGCSSGDSDAEATPDASSEAESVVVADYTAAFNAEDVAAVMASSS